MAFSNLGRNKKSTVIAIISMSLSIVLMNTVFILSSSLNLDKYVSRSLTCDYQLAQAGYFNNDYKEIPVSENFVDAFKSQQGFKDGGGIYTDYSLMINTEYVGDFTGISGQTGTYTKDDGVATNIYAMDNFPLANLELYAGEYNKDKFESGDYLMMGISSDDFGNVDEKDLLYKVGDKVTLKELTDFEINTDNSDVENINSINDVEMIKTFDGYKKEYTIMGIYKLNYTNSSRSYIDGFTFALPVSEFGNWGAQPKMMTYIADGEQGYDDQLNLFLEKYTTQSEVTMDYNSKETYKSEFIQFKNMIVTVGGVLSTIIGLIGILNFINSISTSIIARQNEFAMLKSIGMTDKQLKKMLVCEGIYYALLTTVFAFSTVFAATFTIIRTFVNSMWFFSFKFTILPITLACAILIVLSLVIPIMIYHKNSDESIVEQLRES